MKKSTIHLLAITGRELKLSRSVLVFFLNLLTLPVLNLSAQAQNVGISSTGATPNGSAMLDIVSSTKGLLIPRVSLSATNSTSPIVPVPGIAEAGLLVYNTATAGASPDNVVPGYYYWDGTKWIAFSGAGSNNWSLLGNAGTVDGTNFIGTTDNTAFNIRVDGQKAGRIDEPLENTFWGFQSGNGNTTGYGNTAIGYAALYSTSSTWYNTAIGAEALYSNTNIGNTALGGKALRSNTSGGQNAASGMMSLFANTTGSANTADGYFAVWSNTTGNENTGGGFSALQNNTTGSYNTAYGSSSLAQNVVGDSNTALGYHAFFTGTFSNSTALGANSQITASDQVVLGDANVTSLFCLGAYAATTPNPANLYVDNTGQIMRSTTAGGNNWSLTGNAGTIDGTNFIGTTDNIPFNIRVNNQNSGRIDNTLGNATFGYLAGNSLTTGSHNTAIGSSALATNTSPSDNTAIGYNALTANNSSWNTAMGSSALKSNFTGIGNTAMGYQALYTQTAGNWNTGIGYQALYNNTADDNIAIGMEAMLSNTSGFQNIGIGVSALLHNTTGFQNIAIGQNALGSNLIGNYNTAQGYGALYNNNGDSNTGFGAQALYNNVSGTNNLAVGYGALYATTSSNNIGIGYQTGQSNITGVQNLYIGNYSDAGASNLDNSMALGYFTSVGASNKIVVGNTSVGTIGGQVGWTTYSDKRVKEDVREDVKGLEFIMKLRPVTYHYNIHTSNSIMGIKDNNDWKGKYDIEKKRFSGFIAQEVEETAKQTGYDFSGVDKPENSKGLYGLRYAEFVVPMVKAMQEQQQMIDALKADNNNQKITIDNLQSKNSQKETEIAEMKAELKELKTAFKTVVSKNRLEE